MHHASSSTSRPKRSRQAAPNPFSQPLTQLTPEHQRRIRDLEGFQFHPSMQLELEELEPFGWDQQVRSYLEGIGWEFLLRAPPQHIYRRATIEFLATVALTDSSSASGQPSQKIVRYWMNGAYRSHSLEDFNILMGFVQPADTTSPLYTQAYLDRPESFLAMDMWGTISEHIFMPTNLKASMLQPPLRIAHKLLAATIHARRESPGKVTQADLFILYCMHQGLRCNPGAFFLKALRNFGTRVVTRGDRGYIMQAPFITPLAELWQCPDKERIPRNLRPETIDAPILAHMGLLQKRGERYVLNPSFSMTFSREEIDELLEGPTPAQPEHEASYQPHQHQQQQYSDQSQSWSGISEQLRDFRVYNETQFDRIHRRQDEFFQRQEEHMRTIDERLGRLELHYRRPSPPPEDD